MKQEHSMAVIKSFIDNAIDSNRFTFKDDTFTAEASDFKGHNYERQIYDDACDIGIAIKSSVTGKVMKFHLHDTKIDNDNDILFWEYHPCSEDARDPKLKNLKVIIFND
jgi:hypothetical protein